MKKNTEIITTEVAIITDMEALCHIYAAKYELYLPDKKLLQKKLEQWLAEEGE